MPRKGAKLVQGTATVRGLRFEKNVLAGIVEYADQMAAAHGTEPNLAAAVRVLVAQGLGLGSHACSYEAYMQALGEARRRIGEAGAP